MSKYDELQQTLQAHYTAEDPDYSWGAWLAECVLGITTYEEDASEWFAEIIIRAAHAISTRTTFDYIEDDERRHDYLIAVNLPFFAGRLEWGGSIRGAWWDGDQVFDIIGREVKVSRNELALFFEALAEFAGVEIGPALDAAKRPDEVEKERAAMRATRDHQG